MSEWRSYKLGELYSFSSGLSKSREFFGSGYGFVSFKDVFYNYFIPDTLTEFVQSNEKERTSCSVKRGDVFLTRTSETMHELGQSSVALRDYENATFNGFTKRLRPKEGEKVVLPEFAGYYFRSPKFRAEVSSFAIMTTRASLNNEILERLTITLPGLQTQREIASILRSLDVKIELNNAINKNLEELAQALFKHWFVDFEFRDENGEPYKSSGGEMVESELGAIPKGWAIKSIEDISTKVGMGPFGANIKVETFVQNGVPILSGQHLKNTLVEDNIFNFITEIHAEKLRNSIVTAGDVIFTHAGNIGQVSYLHSAARFPYYILSQRQFYLRPDTEIISGLFLTLFFKNPIGQGKLLANASSTGVPSLARPVSYLRSIKLAIPPRNISSTFDEVMSSIYNIVATNKLETDSLSRLRDTLLPKLISGELTIQEAEQLTKTPEPA